MDIEKYVSSITDSVTFAAELGDEHTRRVAGALATAIAAPVRLELLRALSDMATEVDRALGDRTVTARLDGNEVVVTVHTEPVEPHPEPTPTFEEMTGDISRVTLRLVEQIKNRAEEAAAQNGVSLNSWVAQAVQGALREQTRYQRRAEEWRWPGTTKPTSPPTPEKPAPEKPAPGADDAQHGDTEDTTGNDEP